MIDLTRVVNEMMNQSSKENNMQENENWMKFKILKKRSRNRRKSNSS